MFVYELVPDTKADDTTSNLQTFQTPISGYAFEWKEELQESLNG